MKGDAREPLSMQELVSSIMDFRGRVTSGDALAVAKALSGLRRVKCLPAAYVDSLQDELLELLAQPLPKEAMTSVYLAFHGMDGRAAFMKVGVARNVKSRMRELYTGNPMPRLWTFSLELPSRSLAYRIEAEIHEHLRHSRSSGEWFQIHGIAEDAVGVFVDSISEVAADLAGKPAVFLRMEV